MGKRKTNVEKCIENVKIRSKIYREKNKIKNNLLNISITEKEFKKNSTALGKLNVKLQKVNIELFTCGKRYLKIKAKRRSSKSKLNRLIKKIDVTVDEKETVKLSKEIFDLKNEIRDFERIMKINPVKIEETIRLEPEEKDVSEYSDTCNYWELKQNIDSVSGGGVIETVIFETVSYDLSTDKLSLFWAIDKFVSELDKTRVKDTNKPTPTEMNFLVNIRTKTIKIEDYEL